MCSEELVKAGEDKCMQSPRYTFMNSNALYHMQWIAKHQFHTFNYMLLNEALLFQLSDMLCFVCQYASSIVSKNIAYQRRRRKNTHITRNKLYFFEEK